MCDNFWMFFFSVCLMPNIYSSISYHQTVDIAIHHIVFNANWVTLLSRWKPSKASVSYACMKAPSVSSNIHPHFMRSVCYIVYTSIRIIQSVVRLPDFTMVQMVYDWREVAIIRCVYYFTKASLIRSIWCGLFDYIEPWEFPPTHSNEVTEKCGENGRWCVYHFEMGRFFFVGIHLKCKHFMIDYSAILIVCMAATVGINSPWDSKYSFSKLNNQLPVYHIVSKPTVCQTISSQKLIAIVRHRHKFG